MASPARRRAPADPAGLGWPACPAMMRGGGSGLSRRSPPRICAGWVCVPVVRVADPVFNADAHLRSLSAAYGPGPSTRCVPSWDCAAYSCGDLFFQEALLRGSLDALAPSARATEEWNLSSRSGAAAVDDCLFNCAVTLYRGRRSRWPRRPTRRLSRVLRAALVPSGDYARADGRPPARRRRAVRHRCARPCLRTCRLRAAYRHLRGPLGAGAAGHPGCALRRHRAGQPVGVEHHGGKWEYRQELVRTSSARNLAVQLYSAAGFGESTSDLAWDGHGLIAERGVLIGETPRFALGGTYGRSTSTSRRWPGPPAPELLRCQRRRAARSVRRWSSRRPANRGRRSLSHAAPPRGSPSLRSRRPVGARPALP